MDTPLKDVAAAFQGQEVGLAATQALTDSMVERLVTTAAHGLEVLDRLNNDETRAAVHRALDGLTSMHTTGSLDAMFELADLVQAARSAMTDQMIERLYHFMETMVNSLATQEIADFARDAELSLYDAARMCDSPEAPKGLWGVLRSLSKPETIQTLNLLVAFGNCLRERTQSFEGHLPAEPVDKG
jgi:uncharacterized protein YjgD (DUF1641 family)